MAVLDIFEAYVSGSSGVLPEFDDPNRSEDADESETVKYIEATANDHFSLHYKVGHGFTYRHGEHLHVDITVNGSKMVGVPISDSRYKRAGNCYEGKRTGTKSGSGADYLLRRFQFGHLSICKSTDTDWVS